MVFDRLAATDFNPMRDVWLPLDLSNAASFNALMAHSAAHLARMQGYRNSDTALRFKAEAIRIVTEWMGDPNLCMSDEIIAAVLRLLTYEVPIHPLIIFTLRRAILFQILTSVLNRGTGAPKPSGACIMKASCS